MLQTRNRLLVRISAPVEEPITLDEAKLYLRIDHDDDDTLIEDLIVAARMAAESWLRRSLITQSWKLTYDDYLPKDVTLPMGPVDAVTSVTIVNRDGTTQLVDEDTYYLNAGMNTLMADSIIIGFQVEVLYVTGYGDTEAVPQPIKQGLLSHIASMYDSRGEYGTGAISEQAVHMYLPFREVRV